MSGLNVSVVTSPSDPDSAVFRLQGQLDAQTVRNLESFYREEPAISHHRWVMDLSRLEYVSSAGFGSFVSAVGWLRAEGGDLVFVGATRKVSRVLKVMGF